MTHGMSDTAPSRWPDWLARHGLSHLHARLAEEGVRDDVIDQLTEADLADLGVNLGDRKRFMRALADWTVPGGAVLASADSSTPPLQDGEDAERRQLTILFCDLVDSTALCQALTPEVWRDTVLHYQRVAGEVLAAHGGTVAQYLGDGLLVYFGFPIAQEDAPVQAVHAGLGIVKALADQPCLASGRPVSLRVRVGIDTGLVVVGDMGDGTRRERLALGDAPNVAARLQSLAAPGEVLVSDATWPLVHAHVEGQSRGVHALKGRRHATEVWQVQRSRHLSHRFDAQQRADWTPLVGRQAELQTLVQAWHDAADGRGRVVWVEADPGMGKSRLVGALREQAGLNDTQAWVWQTSAPWATRSFQVAAQALATRSGITRVEGAEARGQQWCDWLGTQGGVSPLHEALLTRLLGLPVAPDAPDLPTSADERQQAMGRALQALLQGMSVRAPFLWLIEDLHWADASTLQWLDAMVSHVAGWPVLLVITTRPELAWRPAAAGHLQRLTLSRLSQDEVQGLVDHTLRHHALSPAWRELIAQRTDGVPLFVEELARALAGSAAPATADESWLNTVPQTLQGLLRARLDRVGPRARQVAQAAAVIGRDSPRALLQSLVRHAWGDELEQADADDAVAELVAAGLLVPRGLRGEAHHVAFKHALVQDVAYESMVQAQRMAWHGALLEVLLRDAAVVQSDPALLARHADAALQRARAVPWWLQASEQALQQLSLSDALTHLRAGLQSAEALPESALRNRHLLQLHAMLGTVHMLAKGWAAPEVAEAYGRAHALAQAADGVEEALWPLWGICVFHQVRGELNEAVATGRRLLTVARQSHSRLAWLVTNMMHTQLCLYSGQPAEVPAHVEQVLHRYSDPADRALMALYSTDLLLVAQVHGLHARWMLGEPIDLEQACQAQEARAAALNHPYSMAWVWSWGAMVLLHDRQVQALRPRLQQALTLADEHGYAYVQGMTRFALGWCQCQPGEGFAPSAGIEAMRDGLQAFQATGAGIVVPFFQTLLAEVLTDHGELAEALALLQSALAQVDAHGERWYEPETWRLLARVLSLQALDPESARHALQQAVLRARAQGAGRWLARAEADWQRQFSAWPLP